jgi:hypothetical protein
MLKFIAGVSIGFLLGLFLGVFGMCLARIGEGRGNEPKPEGRRGE